MAQAKKKTGKAASAKGGKAPAAGARGTKKTAPPPPPPPPPEIRQGRGPLLVLIIMILAASVAFLLNREFSRDGKFLKTGKVAEQKEKDDRSRDESAAAEKAKDRRDRDEAGKAPGEPEGQKVPPPVMKDIRIFLVAFDPATEAVSLRPVTRKVNAATPLDAAMDELMKGPSAAEKKKGLITAIPGGLKIRGITVRDGIAEIDFNERIGEGAAGNILLSRIDQIVYTATQFPGIHSVQIRINGRKQKTLGADGLAIEGPLHRRK